MLKSELALWTLVRAIVEGDAAGFSRLLAASPTLASACFHTGATRQTAKKYFLHEIGRYVLAGDTALHIAAAAYETEVVRQLITAGADVRARNPYGQNIHAARA